MKSARDGTRPGGGRDRWHQTKWGLRTAILRKGLARQAGNAMIGPEARERPRTREAREAVAWEALTRTTERTPGGRPDRGTIFFGFAVRGQG